MPYYQKNPQDMMHLAFFFSTLAEYKVRRSPFERDYLLGKYGATPLISDMESIFNPSKQS